MPYTDVMFVEAISYGPWHVGFMSYNMGYLHSRVSKTKCVMHEEVMKLGAFLACSYICRWVFHQLGALEADNLELVNGHPGIVSIPLTFSKGPKRRHQVHIWSTGQSDKKQLNICSS